MYKKLSTPSGVVIAFLASGMALLATSSWEKEDPAQWTSEDVYQILNKSPWAKTVTVLTTRAYGQNGGGGTWGEGVPGGMGRMGGGWGGGGMGGRRGGGRQTQQQGPVVTVRWVSALPVRLAEAKMDGNNNDAAATKPLNEYVIALLGFPKSAFEGQGYSSTSNDASDDAGLADHLKTITVLSFGDEQINPTKVELNQGRDGRAVFHFEKLGSINPKEKDIEFRITSEHAELKKKFPLKDMEFQGKLEL